MHAAARRPAEGPYLHQMWGHDTPGPHHVQQRSVLVPDDPQHGLAQTEEMERAASVERRLGLTCRHRGGKKTPSGSFIHVFFASDLRFCVFKSVISGFKRTERLKKEWTLCRRKLHITILV